MYCIYSLNLFFCLCFGGIDAASVLLEQTRGTAANTKLFKLTIHFPGGKFLISQRGFQGLFDHILTTCGLGELRAPRNRSAAPVVSSVTRFRWHLYLLEPQQADISFFLFFFNRLFWWTSSLAHIALFRLNVVLVTQTQVKQNDSVTKNRGW